MDISSLITAQTLFSNRLTENVLNLKVGQQLDVKVISAEIQAAKNAIALTLGNKDITVQSNQTLILSPGQDLKIQVTQLAPIIEFKILDSLPESKKQTIQEPPNPPAELRLKLISTARDGGSAASGREPMRPTARDGGSAASGRESMRPTARDGGSAASGRESMRPTARDGGSAVSGRESMRPTATDQPTALIGRSADNKQQDGIAPLLTARQTLDAKIIGITGNKIQLQLVISTGQTTTAAAGNKQVINIDRTQLTNAATSLRIGQNLNLEVIKPGAMAEFKIIPTVNDGGQLLAAKITAITGNKIQLQLAAPTALITTEPGNKQVIKIDRAQLTNTPQNLKVGQNLNLEVIKPSVMAEFKVVPSINDGGRALAAKITAINGNTIQLQVVTPTIQATTESGDTQVIVIDRSQLANAPADLKVGQKLVLDIVKPASAAEFKVIPVANDGGQALAAKITAINGNKIQLQVVAPSTTEAGDSQVIHIDRSQLANAPADLKVGQKLNLDVSKPAGTPEFKVIPTINDGAQALAAKITAINGNKIQLQVFSPTIQAATEAGDSQVITIDRSQLANAPADLKVGQKLDLGIVKPETPVEFKVIPANDGGQALAAKITAISGNKIQLQVFTPTIQATTEAGDSQVIHIDRSQLANAPADLKVGQKLNLDIVKPETPVEFKVIPANDGGQALAAKITAISGNKIQLQVFTPTLQAATEAGDSQVIHIDRSQLVNAPADLKVGQKLNLGIVKAETPVEFKVIPANDGQALAAKITAINGNKIQLQVFVPSTTEAGDSQVIAIDRSQLANAPADLKVGQKLNLDIVKAETPVEFKVIPANDGRQAVIAKITAINGNNIQLQLASPTPQATTEAGDPQIISIDRSQLANAPADLKVGQKLALDIVKPASVAEFKVIPVANDGAQALAAKITAISGNKIQLQVFSPTIQVTTEAGAPQIIAIDRSQLANAPADLKVGQKLALDIVKAETPVEFKVIPVANDGGQALAAKITAINGNNIQLQVFSPATAEIGSKQMINIDRTQLTNAPANLKVGQKLNLEITKPETSAEFKVSPTVNQGGQTLAAKITAISGNNIQLQVFSSPTMKAGDTKVINIDRAQLANAPTDLKVGQKLNMEITQPETPAEFKVIPANQGGPVLAAKITGITGNNIQLQVFTAAATEGGNTQIINIDRTQLANAPADLKVGQSLNLQITKPETSPEFKIIPVANNIPEAKITEFIKQFLPRHEASPIFLNQLIKDLPQLMKNKSVPQAVKDIAAKIVGNLPPREQLVTSQGLKQAIANSGLFLEAKLPLAMTQPELIKELPQLIKNESVPQSLQRIAVEILQNLTQKEPVPSPVAVEQAITRSTLIPESELLPLRLNPTDDSVEGRAVSQTGVLPGNGVQVDDFKENLLKFIHALKQEISQQSEQHNQVDLDLLKNLQNKTENTVAKVVLDQLMSLPKDDSSKQLWIVDIPFIDRQQAEAVKIEIQQDKENKQQFGGNSDWSVNITLTPPELGTIHCIVSFRDKVINTYFKSQSAQTTELIKSNLDYLKNQLEEAGLTMGHMDAHAGSQKTQVPRQLAGQRLFDDKA